MLYPKIAIDVTARLTELPSGNIGLLPLTLADDHDPSATSHREP